MSRWTLEMDSNEIVASPNFPVLSEYVIESAKKLQERILSYEQELILQALPTADLTRLVSLCENEIKRRKGGDDDLR